MNNEKVCNYKNENKFYEHEKENNYGNNDDLGVDDNDEFDNKFDLFDDEINDEIDDEYQEYQEYEEYEDFKNDKDEKDEELDETDETDETDEKNDKEDLKIDEDNKDVHDLEENIVIQNETETSINNNIENNIENIPNVINSIISNTNNSQSVYFFSNNNLTLSTSYLNGFFLYDIISLPLGFEEHVDDLIDEEGLDLSYNTSDDLNNVKEKFLSNCLDLLKKAKDTPNENVFEIEISAETTDCILTYETFKNQEELYILDDCFTNFYKYDTLEQIFTVQKSYLNPFNQLAIQRILKFKAKI